MVGLLHAMAFMVLLLIGWVIWNNKPLPLPLPLNGLKKCLCMRSSALVFTQCKRKTHANGLKKFLFVRIKTSMWWNQVHRWCCGKSKPNPIPIPNLSKPNPNYSRRLGFLSFFSILQCFPRHTIQIVRLWFFVWLNCNEFWAVFIMTMPSCVFKYWIQCICKRVDISENYAVIPFLCSTSFLRREWIRSMEQRKLL